MGAQPDTDAAYSGEDLDVLKSWIGREETMESRADDKALARFVAIFEDSAADTGDLPPGIHWTLFNAINPLSKLGPDGHPEKGGFMPPIVLPRRMWAGGQLEFLAPLRLGEALTKTSRIADVTFKTGGTGPLVFVTVEHEISDERGIAIKERQDIVYRAAATTMLKLPDPDPGAASAAPVCRPVNADPVLLFRFSALTENSHRIHYDEAYAREEEFYPGLVVHGPLQATYLMLLATKIGKTPLRNFSFRGVSPLIANGAFTLHVSPAEDGVTKLNTCDGAGRICMTAKAGFAAQ